MKKVELCEKIKKATRKVMVVGEDKILKTGTGVTIDERGAVLTAGHVLCDDDGELLDGTVIVDTDEAHMETEPAFSGDLAVELNYKGMNMDVEIDLNVLCPPEGLPDQDCLPLHDGISQVGEDVILAGYPDEITLEFDPDDMVDYDAYGGDPRSRLQKEFFHESLKPEMLKQGMVGNVQVVDLRGIDLRPMGLDDHISMQGAYYSIDTHLTTGGSGGPVVNQDGELIGIVIRRSKTELDNRLLRLLPAGTGIAVSHHLVTWVLDYLE